MYTHLDYTVRSRQKQKKLPLRLNKKGLYRQNFSINERNLIPKKRKTAIKQPPLKRHFPLRYQAGILGHSMTEMKTPSKSVRLLHRLLIA